jgi:hypothetical protein
MKRNNYIAILNPECARAISNECQRCKSMNILQTCCHCERSICSACASKEYYIPVCSECVGSYREAQAYYQRIGIYVD